MRLQTINRHSSNHESGQAIAEMCIGLIGIMVVFLGILFVAGLTISNVKIFLEAKNNAEYRAHNNAADSAGAGTSIYNWNYGTYEIRNNSNPAATQHFTMPFSYNDQYTRISDDNINDTDATFNTQISSSSYSQSIENNDYIYEPISSLTDPVRNNFTRSLGGLFLNAAALVHGASGDNESFYTLNSNLIGTRRERDDLKYNFGNLIGVDVSRIDLQQMPANQVYMPSQP